MSVEISITPATTALVLIDLQRGISTNIGVESTARAAHERGLEQIFVEDAMAARETDLHDFPLTRFFPTIGRVRSTQQLLDALAAANSG